MYQDNRNLYPSPYLRRSVTLGNLNSQLILVRMKQPTPKRIYPVLPLISSVTAFLGRMSLFRDTDLIQRYYSSADIILSER